MAASDAVNVRRCSYIWAANRNTTATCDQANKSAKTKALRIQILLLERGVSGATPKIFPHDNKVLWTISVPRDLDKVDTKI